MMGFKENKKDEDPTIKVNPLMHFKINIMNLTQVYRAYKPYVSVVLHIPEETPKKALIKKEKKTLEKKDVIYTQIII